MRTCATLSLCLALASPSLLVAQRIWIVDLHNRPGTDFTNLPAAVAKAQHGDIVFMRNATYKLAATISKALRLVGEGRVTIQLIAPPLGPKPKGLVVTGIPAGKSFSMHGITINVKTGSSRPDALISIRNNLGQVHLDTVRVGSSSAFLSKMSYAIDIQNSSVTLRNVTSNLTLRAKGCHVDIEGGQYLGSLTPGQRPIWMQPHPGIDATTTILRMTGASCSARVNKYYGPSTALLATSSGLEVREGCRFVSMGTVEWLKSDLSLPSVLALESKLAIPKMRYSGFLKVVSRRLANLRSGKATLGGTASAVLTAPSGHLFVLFVGASAKPTYYPPFGDLWLDLRSTVLLHGGVLNSSGRFQAQFPIPNEPKLGGFPLTFQALVGPITAMEFTNVAVPLLR